MELFTFRTKKSQYIEESLTNSVIFPDIDSMPIWFANCLILQYLSKNHIELRNEIT